MTTLKQLLRTWSARLSFSFIVFLLFVALTAPFWASNIPFVIFSNDSAVELPRFPLITSLLSHKNKRLITQHPYRAWAKEKKITAWFTPVAYNPYETNLDKILQPPNFSRFGHYFGTDYLGRDIGARLIYGARTSMSVGMIAVFISFIIGVFIGSLAGYYGGWIDIALSRLIEIVITFPTLILIMAVVALLKPSLINIMIIIGITGWTGIARVIRAEFLRRKNLEFVLSAKLTGASNARIIFLHILPNSLAPVLVMLSFGVASAVFLESSLSFLGIGIQPPDASWGQLINSARAHMDIAWWIITFPGFLIFLTVIAYNLLGERIRQMLSAHEAEL